MCSTRLKKVLFLAFLLFVFEFNSFAEESLSSDELFEAQNQELVAGNPLLSEDEIAQLTSRSFSKDFSKYHFSKRMKIEHSCRVIIPVGLGVALVLVSGPGGVVPLIVGVGYGIKARVDYVQNKKVRSLLKGSLLWLHKVDESQMPSRNRKRLKAFDRFFNCVKKDLRTHLDQDVSDEQLKTYLAYQLLIINRYGPVIVERYKNVKGTKWWQGPQTEIFSEGFLRNNLIFLINDCSQNLVSTMNCDHLDKMVAR